MPAFDQLSNNHPTDSAEYTTLGKVLADIITAATEDLPEPSDSDVELVGRDDAALVALLQRAGSLALSGYAMLILKEPEWRRTEMSPDEAAELLRALFPNENNTTTATVEDTSTDDNGVGNKQNEQLEEKLGKSREAKLGPPAGYIPRRQAERWLLIGPDRLKLMASKAKVAATTFEGVLCYKETDIEQLRILRIEDIKTEIDITEPIVRAMQERGQNNPEYRSKLNKLGRLRLQLRRLSASLKVPEHVHD